MKYKATIDVMPNKELLDPQGKTVAKNNWLQILYWGITVLVIGNFIYHYYGFNRSDGFSHAHAYAFGVFIALLVPKMVLLHRHLHLFRGPQSCFPPMPLL